MVKTSSNDPNLRYTPYGSPLGGSIWVQSLFTWVGSFGYRVTNAKYIESYVRARHYSAKSGAWTNVDPLWPTQRAYGYVAGGPVNLVDPTGLGPKKGRPGWDRTAGKNIYADFYKRFGDCGYSPEEAKTLATLMMCIAYGESNYNSSTVADGATGLFQITLGQQKIAKDEDPDSCSGSLTKSGVNKSVIFRLLSVKCEANPGASAYDLLSEFQGVLQGVRALGGPVKGQQNNLTMSCLADHGLVKARPTWKRTGLISVPIFPDVWPPRDGHVYPKYDFIKPSDSSYAQLNKIRCRKCS